MNSREYKELLFIYGCENAFRYNKRLSRNETLVFNQIYGAASLITIKDMTCRFCNVCRYYENGALLSDDLWLREQDKWVVSSMNRPTETLGETITFFSIDAEMMGNIVPLDKDEVFRQIMELDCDDYISFVRSIVRRNAHKVNRLSEWSIFDLFDVCRRIRMLYPENDR